MKSIRWKLVIIYVALIFIVLILTGTFIIISFRNQEENRAESDLLQYASNIKVHVISEYENSEDLQLGLESLSGSRIQGNILDANGTTIASNLKTQSGLFQRYESSVIISAQHGNESFLAGRKRADENGVFTKWIEYACPVFIPGSGEVDLIIYLRINADSIYDSIDETINTLVLSILIALILTGFLGIIFSGTLTGPISILSSKARELAAGNLDQVIPVASKDEIGQLTESFNYMAAELKKTISEMATEKNKMEIVLYNMTDGVIAYDGAGNFLHSNHISEELLSSIALDTLSFSETVEHLFPSQDISLANLDNFQESTLTIGDKFISVSISSYNDKQGHLEGAVIVLHDITKHRKLDNMRKEFVANVSHEIRTPLTNIKSYAETLIDGAIDEKEVAIDFLEIINGEVDRMTHIVKDLLELSSLDNRQMFLDLVPTDINLLIKDTIKQLIMTAKNQGKEIVYTEPETSVVLKIDNQRISQVLTNIIANSLKYSYDKTVVEIWIETGSHYTRVFVRDNGMGIPKEDLRNIFDRFYRVDKARSRALGGTGLGLSIAKEIMEAHNGGISALSELSKGTTMILRFPNSDDEMYLSEELVNEDA